MEVLLQFLLLQYSNYANLIYLLTQKRNPHPPSLAATLGNAGLHGNFKKYLVTEKLEALILFWEETEIFFQSMSDSTVRMPNIFVLTWKGLKLEAQRIFNKYLKADSPTSVPLSADKKQNLAVLIFDKSELFPINRGIFRTAQGFTLRTFIFTV